MKGLAVTILLAILELAALATGRGDLMTDTGSIPANRREEAGIQAELLVDAETPEIAGFDRAAPAADLS